MKPKRIVFLLFFLLFPTSIIVAQSKFITGKNLLLPNNIIVNYSRLLDSCYGPLVNGRCSDTLLKPYLKNQEYKNILRMINDSVILNARKVYNPNFTGESYQLFNKLEPLDLFPLNEEVTFRWSSATLCGLNFIEDWVVNENPLSMSKKVLAYSPFFRYYWEGEENKRNPSFELAYMVVDSLVNPNDVKKSDQRMVLTNTVQYEFFLYTENFFYDVEGNINYYDSIIVIANNSGYNLANPKSPFLSKYSIAKLLEFLRDKVLNKELTAYDFDTQKVLELEEVKSNLGLYDGWGDADWGEPLESMNKNKFINEVASIIFIEDWYIDPVTLRMKKIVKGIAPVRYRKNNKGKYTRMITFQINLN
ncbi:MAG: hypothetical protein AB9846_09535 [Tenuifilaceae bacterium]